MTTRQPPPVPRQAGGTPRGVLTSPARRLSSTAALHGGVVETQDPRLSPSIDDEAAAHASLQLELRVPERQMAGAFREAFLRWLHDRGGPFVLLGGRPEGLSLDEVPDAGDPQRRSLLRLSVRWSFASQ